MAAWQESKCLSFVVLFFLVCLPLRKRHAANSMMRATPYRPCELCQQHNKSKALQILVRCVLLVWYFHSARLPITRCRFHSGANGWRGALRVHEVTGCRPFLIVRPNKKNTFWQKVKCTKCSNKQKKVYLPPTCQRGMHYKVPFVVCMYK